MKNSTRNKVNLIFSSFLVIGYIVCTYFFSTLANQAGGVVGSLIQALILILFGLLLFYATRVGEGKQVKRFSLAVLLLVDIPCLYIIAASMLTFLPLHDQLTSVTIVMNTGNSINSLPIILMLACVGLGYGIPYTFLSGYEMKTEEPTEEYQPLEGGLAEELAETAAEEAKEADKAEDAAEEAAAEVEEEINEEASAEDAAPAEVTAEEEDAPKAEAEAE